MLYIYIAIAFITGWLLGKMTHKHKYVIKASTNLTILNIQSRFKSNVPGQSKKGSDIHVVYEVCKCGAERLHVGDGTNDEFIYDENIVLAKMKEYSEIQALKNDMKI
jgi:hypothetical protein